MDIPDRIFMDPRHLENTVWATRHHNDDIEYANVQALIEWLTEQKRETTFENFSVVDSARNITIDDVIQHLQGGGK